MTSDLPHMKLGESHSGEQPRIQAFRLALDDCRYAATERRKIGGAARQIDFMDLSKSFHRQDTKSCRHPCEA
jgi:hypothetical protein